MFKPGKNEENGNNNDRHDEQNKPGLPIDGEEHKPTPEVPAGGEDETITDGTVTEEQTQQAEEGQAEQLKAPVKGEEHNNQNGNRRSENYNYHRK